MYDTRTVPVPDAPGAECLTVADGKIVHNRFIFDRLPFAAARRAKHRALSAASGSGSGYENGVCGRSSSTPSR